MLRKLFSKTPRTAETEPGSGRPEPTESRTYTVGWLLNTDNASIIWDSPKPVRIESQSTDQ